MKLILQECWFKWSLNQHHKNKRLPIQAASHTRLSRHFNVLGQRKQRRPQRSKTEDICLVAEVDYNIWLCKPFSSHISSTDYILAEWPVCPAERCYGSVNSELTFHHREAEEVQLFDSKKLFHLSENILTCGLWLEQVKKQKHPQSTERLQHTGNMTGRRSRQLGRVNISTHPNSDVQLVFVGEENTDCSFLLSWSGHCVWCMMEMSTLSLSCASDVSFFLHPSSIHNTSETGWRHKEVTNRLALTQKKWHKPDTCR